MSSYSKFLGGIHYFTLLSVIDDSPFLLRSMFFIQLVLEIKHLYTFFLQS